MNDKISILIGEITSLAFKINSKVPSVCEVNVAFMGHQNIFDVRLYLQGILNSHCPDLQSAVWLEPYCYGNRMLKDLQKIRDSLQKIFETNAVDFSKFKFDPLEVKKYSFI